MPTISDARSGAVAVTALLLTIASGCASTMQTAPPSPTAPAPAADQVAVPKSGVLLENFDRSVRPQDDLYRHVNGGWLARTQIPADRSNYGSFAVLQDRVETQLHAIADEAIAKAATAPRGSELQLIGDLYGAFLDEPAIEAAGMHALHAEFVQIDGIADRTALASYFGRAQRRYVAAPPGVEDFGTIAPFLAFVRPDARDPGVNALYLAQFGLGMPDRDYYLSSEARFVQIREAYRGYLETLGTLAGLDDPAAQARAALALETRLAEAQWTKVALRDVDKAYNPHSLAEAARLVPGFDWNAWLAAAGIAPAPSKLIVGQPSYLEAVARALDEVPIESWRSWLRLRVADDYSALMTPDFVQANFEFRERTLTGVPAMRPRWKRGLQQLEFHLGEPLGRLYVERHFPPEAKQRMDALVDNLLKAFAGSIDELEWMAIETRRAAHAKLAAFSVKIGHPQHWKDYSQVRVRRADLIGSALRLREAERAREFAKVGRPVDRSEWFMTPQTVNAYYNPLANEIVFPAAILQPPFFDLAAEDAVNYGGIGGVIGHEISHGFDDQGRKFDGGGVLRDWWTAEDNQRFQVLAGRLVGQYSAFSPLEGLHVNGQLTLGENIGDLSGLAVAYKAWGLAREDRPAPVLDGYTGEQRFFIGWAQIWARKYRDDELRKRLLTDPHSPTEYRTNGVVRNTPAFVEAFDVGPGDGLYLPAAEQVRIW